MLGLVLVGLPGVAQASSKPVISSFTASPSSLPAAGGTVTLTATVSNVSQCTFSTTAKGLSGLPATVACDSGTGSTSITVPANTTTSVITDTVKLTAAGPKGKKAQTTTVTVAFLPLPVISSFTATPSSLPSTGGTVTLSATVSNGSQCMFSTTATGLSGLPTTLVCDSGTASIIVTVSANDKTKAQKDKVQLDLSGPGGAASASTVITVAAATAPTVSSYSVNPSPVSWTGGSATLSASVTNATTCTFSAKGKAAHAVTGLPATTSCTSGTASAPVTVTANHSKRIASYSVTLTVVGPAGKVTAKTAITVSAVTTPPSISNFTSNPIPVPSTGGPVTLSATVSDATSCTFSATGKAAHVVTGLPATTPCSSGLVSVTADVPANTSKKSKSYPVELQVQGQRKKTSATTFITVAGRSHSG